MRLRPYWVVIQENSTATGRSAIEELERVVRVAVAACGRKNPGEAGTECFVGAVMKMRVSRQYRKGSLCKCTIRVHENLPAKSMEVIGQVAFSVLDLAVVETCRLNQIAVLVRLAAANLVIREGTSRSIGDTSERVYSGDHVSDRLALYLPDHSLTARDEKTHFRRSQ